MMKKIILFIVFMMAITIEAQCSINGKSTISVLSEETYSISSEAAQCKDCHLWINIGGKTSIIGDNKQNSVKLRANSEGREVISLSLLTPQGFMQCSKNIDIMDGNATPKSVQVTEQKNCDIEMNNYKEVKNSEGIVSFFPNVLNDTFKYTWVITYSNGENMTSTEKIPQFPFTKENGISKVIVKINSAKCLKEFSKTYDSNYWKFF